MHCMQRGLSDRRAVRPSACLSITRVYYDKTNESSADIIIPRESKIHLLFGCKEWLLGDAPF